MKKIAIVINSAWAAYNFRFNLAKSLKNNGYKVIIIAPNDKPHYHFIKEEFDFISIDLDADGINPFQDIKLFLSLCRLYKKIKPDVVLNFTIKLNIYSAIAAKFNGVYSVNNVTGLGSAFIREDLLTKIIKRLYKLSFWCASRVFFQNNDDFELFIKNNLVAKTKCNVLPGSGVDTKKFTKNYSKDRKKFRFLMVSRLLRDKGIYEFIDAAEILKNENVEFWVLGDSDAANSSALSKEEVTKLSNLGIVSFFERTDDVKTFLGRVDCVVLPSYREGSPRSIMEASASELPVIVSNVPGCRNVVDNNITGLYCKVKDSYDLAKKMKIMLRMSKSDREKMGERGRNKMLNNFDEAIVLDKYNNVIVDLLKKNLKN